MKWLTNYSGQCKPSSTIRLSLTFFFSFLCFRFDSSLSPYLSPFLLRLTIQPTLSFLFNNSGSEIDAPIVCLFIVHIYRPPRLGSISKLLSASLAPSRLGYYDFARISFPIALAATVRTLASISRICSGRCQSASSPNSLAPHLRRAQLTPMFILNASLAPASYRCLRR